MEGSGVIDLNRLYDEKEIFGFFSEQFCYPEEIPVTLAELDESIPKTHPSYPHLHAYIANTEHKTLYEMQTMYTALFDFQKDATLYMTYVKFEDSKGRGQMLARLKVMYEMFGLNMPPGELADLLPLMCEFIYAAEWKGDPRAQDSMALLLAVLEDGSYHLMNALEKYESVYYHLVRGMRETFKSCITKQEVHAND